MRAQKILLRLTIIIIRHYNGMSGHSAILNKRINR
jgi:hypothetical protein